MSDREQRGLALAALYRIEQQGGKWLVPSQTGNGTRYEVDPDSQHCTCPDHRDRGIKCKHMYAVEFVQTREFAPDGTEVVTRSFKVTEKVTYRQDWPKYNQAQTREKHLFLSLLNNLCSGIVDPPAEPRRGRKSFPLASQLFSAVYKVYSTLSSRRFSCDLQDAVEKGYLEQAPQFNSVLRYLDDEALTPILKALIVESSRPLREIETDFAADSSGFSTCRFIRWFDVKYGKTMTEREWVKVHIMCGVKTNVVSAVEILGKTAADSPQLPALLKTTSETFDVAEVSADAGYSSRENCEAVASVGAIPFIAFKENTTGEVGGLFAKMFHFYCFKKDVFLKHYHKRSNVESTFSMIKAKFGDSVKARSDTAMANEVLCKILCHNLCCLIHSIFELGIEPTFWSEEEMDTPQVAIEETESEAVAALAWV